MTRDELTYYLSSLDDVTHERVADLIACYRDNAEAALWAMKERGEVEHTVDAPVLWRLVVPR